MRFQGPASDRAREDAGEDAHGHERARARSREDISSCAAGVRYLRTSLRTVERRAPRYLMRARDDIDRRAVAWADEDVGLLPAAQVCITRRYVKGGAPRRGGRGRVRIMCTLCAPRAPNKSRAARSETALGGAGVSPRSSPAPGASASQLAEGGPRDAAWAAGPGATDSPALATGGRGLDKKRAAHTEYVVEYVESVRVAWCRTRACSG